MGSACCCLRVEDFEEYLHPNSSLYRHCICLRCFIQQFVSVYTSLFHRGVHAVPSSIQGVAPLASQGLVPPSLDGTVPDTYRSPPRPLPYDADPRCTHLQRGPVSRFEKASSHFHEEEEPLRRSNSNAEPEALGVAEKWNGSDHEGGSKESRSGYPSRKMISGAAYLLSSTEDEDVCPTCLEEYSPENPKIMTQCSHHFHLGCIYEWMERSETCPVCGKAIVTNWLGY
ncbi:E3 ubiquitin-protein ligase [Cinnamomum micranthum f. kanehirae]|uniref:RING-type E3 ubiquitin transferase n=1 Tax=Cinnamomum micranthum f. kanehirae TaxID=337451 RepID=A0A443NXK4_9MAGN|nr:E3 ubiquitin-protein ligase [Cinnamomum micranthum f. kanehirae]